MTWTTFLRAYQKVGADWLSNPPSYARARILADPVGFGKTWEGLAAARKRIEELQPENRTTVVITTALGRSDWVSIAGKYWPAMPTYEVGVDAPKYQRVGESDEAFEARRAQPIVAAISGAQPTLVVSSFALVDQLRELCIQNNVLIDQLIIDEAHCLKYARTETTKVVRQLMGRSSWTGLMTGTPLHNRPHDLHNLLDLCAMAKIKSKFVWAEKYFMIRVGERGFGRVIGELLDKERLRRDIEPLVLRRSIKEAYGELPARIRQLKKIQVEGVPKISPVVARKMKGKLDALLRQAASKKLQAAADLALELDEPVVLYAYEKKHADELFKRLTKLKVTAILATGDLTADKRAKEVERWKNGAATALVCTMDAVRESATLTRAAAMIFADFHWLPGIMLQCEGRIDPARQPEGERRPARYYYIVVENGPDEVVAERVVEKLGESAGVLGEDANADGLMQVVGQGLDLRVAKSVDESEAMADLVARVELRCQRMMDLGLMFNDED